MVPYFFLVLYISETYIFSPYPGGFFYIYEAILSDNKLTTYSPLVEGIICSPVSAPVTTPVDLFLFQVLLSDFVVVLLYLLNRLL